MLYFHVSTFTVPLSPTHAQLSPMFQLSHPAAGQLINKDPSSPTHASSNGLSEVYVKIAKRILQKSKDDNRDPYLPLLEYRNTPLKCGYSPAQLLMGRRLRSILPSTNKQLMPKTVDPNKARKKMTEQQNRTKQHYDKTARKLPPLKVGEPVHIQRDKFWEPAKVVSQHNEHSFKVRTPEGATYRRNRKFLNKTPHLTFHKTRLLRKYVQHP